MQLTQLYCFHYNTNTLYIYISLVLITQFLWSVWQRNMAASWSFVITSHGDTSWNASWCIMIYILITWKTCTRPRVLSCWSNSCVFPRLRYASGLQTRSTDVMYRYTSRFTAACCCCISHPDSITLEYFPSGHITSKFCSLDVWTDIFWVHNRMKKRPFDSSPIEKSPLWCTASRRETLTCIDPQSRKAAIHHIEVPSVSTESRGKHLHRRTGKKCKGLPFRV